MTIEKFLHFSEIALRCGRHISEMQVHNKILNNNQSGGINDQRAMLLDAIFNLSNELFEAQKSKDTVKENEIAKIAKRIVMDNNISTAMVESFADKKIIADFISMVNSYNVQGYDSVNIPNAYNKRIIKIIGEKTFHWRNITKVFVLIDSREIGFGNPFEDLSISLSETDGELIKVTIKQFMCNVKSNELLVKDVIKNGKIIVKTQLGLFKMTPFQIVIS